MLKWEGLVTPKASRSRAYWIKRGFLTTHEEPRQS